MAKAPTWAPPLAAVALAVCSVPAAVRIFFPALRLCLPQSSLSVRCCWPISAMPGLRVAIVCSSARPSAHLPFPLLALRRRSRRAVRLRRLRLPLPLHRHRAPPRSHRSDHVVFGATRREKTSHLRVNSRVVWKAKTFAGSSCHPDSKNRGRGEIGRHAILRG